MTPDAARLSLVTSNSSQENRLLRWFQISRVLRAILGFSFDLQHTPATLLEERG